MELKERIFFSNVLCVKLYITVLEGKLQNLMSFFYICKSIYIFQSETLTIYIYIKLLL